MQRILLAIFLGALVVSPVYSQELTGDKAEAVKKAILSLEHEKVAGLRGENSGHADWVEHYDSDSIVQVDADGSMRTKVQHLSELRAGDSKVLTMNQYQYELHVYNDGNTVVVTNRATGTLQKRGEVKPVESRFTDVWVKQNGQWHRVVHDITDVKQ